jgi:hypothetical protein
MWKKGYRIQHFIKDYFADNGKNHIFAASIPDKGMWHTTLNIITNDNQRIKNQQVNTPRGFLT